MKLNIFHILIVASISGVISDDNGIVINGKNNTDVPTASTIVQNITTPIPHTTTTNSSTNITTTSPTPPSTPSTTASTSTTTTTVTPPTVTTPASNETSSTAAPSSTTMAPGPVPPSHRGRKFDGPSFIGGIILASGLMAICFVSWKFYKARTERNYHTL